MPAAPPFLVLPLPAPFRAAVSTRRGGVSPPPWESLNQGTSTGDEPVRVEKNRAILAASLGLREGPWASVSQVHGTDVREVREAGAAGPADALWTDRAGLVLSLRVADCAAVALAHPGTGRLGLAHAGWRGAAAGVVTALARAMASPPSEMFAAISPHLGPCCFEVGPDVVEAFAGRFCTPRSGDRSTLHLGDALASELAALGLEPERICRSALCTSCERGSFYSHRGEGARTGRMAAVAWRSLDPPPTG